MKILVTGANGFMGHGIIDRLSLTDNEIIASDFTEYKSNKKNVKSISGDLFQLENPYEYYEKPDIVLHLAWRDGFKHNSQNHIFDLPKHYSFLHKMVESGVSKLVVLGSMHEIGFHEGSINEFTECNPLSLYGIAKNSLRQMCELMIKDTNTKLQWVRGFYIVDNSTNGCSIFSKLMNAANQGEKKFPFTSGKNQYDFLDYEEFCNQISSICLNNEIFGIINACSGLPVPLATRVEKFIEENHLDIQLDYGAFPDRPYDSLAVWGNNTKITEILKNS